VTEEEWIQEAMSKMPKISASKKARLALLFRGELPDTRCVDCHPAGLRDCDALPPKDAHECNCGFDFAPDSQELHDCLYGNAAAPSPPSP
jgi:hypothetical protein